MGIAAGLRFPTGAWTFAPGALALGLAIFARFRAGRTAGARLPAPRVLAAASAACAACFAGLWLGSDARHRAGVDCRARLAPGSRVVFEGVALGFLPAGVDGRIALRGPRWTLSDASTCPLTAPVVARLDGPILPGAPVRLEGKWSPYPWASSSGFLDPGRRGTLLVDSASVVAPRFADAPLLALRGALAHRLAALYPPSEAAMAEALVLARRESLDRETYDLFVRAGLAHLLAISGLHVGLIALGWLFLLRVARVPRRALFPCTAAGVVLYVLVIGAPASAVRATVMVLAALLARHAGRPSGAWDLFALAAVVILVSDPGALVEPGFQLSFAGAVSATFAASASRDWLRKRGATAHAVAVGLAVSTATFLGTLPFTLAHFGRVSVVGIVSNLAAVPLLGLALPALFASLVLSPLPALAGVAADAALALLTLLRTVAEVSAAPGWAALEVPPIGLGTGVVLAVLVWLVLRGVRGPEHRARAIVGLGAAAACWVAAPVVAPLLHRGGPLEIVALDVGQGDAIALRTPAGRWVLVDAGLGGVRGDAGARVVVPYLRSRGVRGLEALILSHPHADHIGGAPAVFERMRVRRVLDPGHLAGGASYTRVLERVAHDELELLLPRTGDWAALDGLRIRFLAPSDSVAALAADPNDASLWFLLTYGEFRAAFTGDASTAVESVAARAAGPVTLLKVAHHGSTTASSREALSLLRPQVAVVSAGRRNRYGHPHPAVLDRLARSGADVRRTDREGTIHLEAWPSGRVRVRRP